MSLLTYQKPSLPLSSVSYGPEYIYSLNLLSSTQAIASLSDRSLRIFDLTRSRDGGSIKETSKILNAHVKNISGVSVLADQPNIVASSAEDGIVKVWDLRSTKAVASMSCGSPLLSLAYSPLTNTIAAGTELVSQDAKVVLFDVRSPASPLRTYADSHNDDVTVLAFHPTTRHSLLSAGTDALITRYDTSIADEDEAVAQVIHNGASVHLTGFLPGVDDAIFAASHIETWSVHKQTNKDDESEDESMQRKEYGDVRESWGCEYIIDVNTQSGYVAVGSNTTSKLALIQLDSSTGEVLPTSRIECDGAHANEVVRCACVNETYGLMLSGGEDGVVKTWQITSSDPEVPEVDEGGWSEKKSKKSKKHHGSHGSHGDRKDKKDHDKKKDKSRRFKPY
ncbi:WD40-repeat-containing domain protein [Myxozyma melibiosi]|uniref:WD40-repeat-containing domain protein n=1 Tax=Myxozyma melibiosi TaxID=54550 RepID=A0ABR1F530_9ASCO